VGGRPFLVRVNRVCRRVVPAQRVWHTWHTGQPRADLLPWMSSNHSSSCLQCSECCGVHSSDRISCARAPLVLHLALTVLLCTPSAGSCLQKASISSRLTSGCTIGEITLCHSSRCNFELSCCLLLNSPTLAYRRVHTHARTRTRTRTHAHARALTHTHWHALAHTGTHTLAHTGTHWHTHAHSLTHTHTLSLSLSHTHTHTHSLSLTHTHTHTLSLSLSHTHTHSLSLQALVSTTMA
jgi:hypothetical protein